MADDHNQVSGNWNERSRSVGGTAAGTARGERMQLHVESGGFSAEVIMQTRGRSQSVNIDSHGGGDVIRATIAMSRN